MGGVNKEDIVGNGGLTEAEFEQNYLIALVVYQLVDVRTERTVNEAAENWGLGEWQAKSGIVVQREEKLELGVKLAQEVVALELMGLCVIEENESVTAMVYQVGKEAEREDYAQLVVNEPGVAEELWTVLAKGPQ